MATDVRDVSPHYLDRLIDFGKTSEALSDTLSNVQHDEALNTWRCPGCYAQRRHMLAAAQNGRSCQVSEASEGTKVLLSRGKRPDMMWHKMHKSMNVQILYHHANQRTAKSLANATALHHDETVMTEEQASLAAVEKTEDIQDKASRIKACFDEKYDENWGWTREDSRVSCPDCTRMSYLTLKLINDHWHDSELHDGSDTEDMTQSLLLTLDKSDRCYNCERSR